MDASGKNTNANYFRNSPSPYGDQPNMVQPLNQPPNQPQGPNQVPYNDNSNLNNQLGGPPLQTQNSINWRQKTLMDRISSIYACSKCCLMTILIILTSIFCYQYSNTGSIFESLGDNWRKDFISDIRVIPATEFCTANEESLILFEWPGTQQGCNCVLGPISQKSCCFSLPHAPTLAEMNQKKSVKVSHKHTSLILSQVLEITKEKSQNEQIKAKHTRTTHNSCCYGRDIDPQRPRMFIRWTTETGANPRAFSLCATRIKGYSLLTSQKKQTCSASEKKCGGQGLGQSDTAFCVPSGSKCPITSFALETTRGTQGLPVIDGWFLNVKRQEKDIYPFIQTKIGEGNGICENPKVYFLSDGRSQYRLLYGTHTSCDFDSRFIPVSKITEYAFFQINNSLDLAAALPGFDISNFYTYSLFQRNVIPLQSQFRYLINDLDKISSGMGGVYSYTIFLIVMASLLCCFGIASAIQPSNIDPQTNDFQFYGHRLGIDNQGKDIKTANCFVISSFIVVVLFIFGLFKIHQLETPFIQFGDSVLTTHCTDVQTEKFFKEYNQGIIKNCFRGFIVCIGLFLITEPTISYWPYSLFKQMCHQKPVAS